MNIPTHIVNKLEQIRKAQLRVKTLRCQIENCYPALAETWDDGYGWTFTMHVDQQGSVMNLDQMIKLLEKFLSQITENQ